MKKSTRFLLWTGLGVVVVGVGAYLVVDHMANKGRTAADGKAVSLLDRAKALVSGKATPGEREALEAEYSLGTVIDNAKVPDRLVKDNPNTYDSILRDPAGDWAVRDGKWRLFKG
jgi:hypothetical protein